MTSPSRSHATIAANFGELVDNTTDWDAPTPVPEWTTAGIVDHLITWPKTVFADWGDLDLTDDPTAPPARRWRHRADALQAVLDEPDVASRPVTVGPFAGQPLDVAIDRAYSADVFMHTWDLATATNQPHRLDPDFARELLNGLTSMEDVLRSSGQYGPAYPTNSTDPIGQLAAFIGRNPNWEPPSHRIPAKPGK